MRAVDRQQNGTSRGLPINFLWVATNMQIWKGIIVFIYTFCYFYGKLFFFMLLIQGIMQSYVKCDFLVLLHSIKNRKYLN